MHFIGFRSGIFYGRCRTTVIRTAHAVRWLRHGFILRAFNLSRASALLVVHSNWPQRGTARLVRKIQGPIFLDAEFRSALALVCSRWLRPSERSVDLRALPEDRDRDVPFHRNGTTSASSACANGYSSGENRSTCTESDGCDQGNRGSGQRGDNNRLYRRAHLELPCEFDLFIHKRTT